MIPTIAKELDAAFREQHVPFHVVFGPESVKYITAAREHVSIDYIVNEKRDKVNAPRATHRNPPVPYNRDQAARMRIFARSNVAGATWTDHSRRAQKVLDHALSLLDEIVRVKRKNIFTPTAGGFVELDDGKGELLYGGAVYEQDFTVDRAVERRTWEGEAGDEVTLGVDVQLEHVVKVSSTNGAEKETASGGTNG